MLVAFALFFIYFTYSFCNSTYVWNHNAHPSEMNELKKHAKAKARMRDGDWVKKRHKCVVSLCIFLNLLDMHFNPKRLTNVFEHLYLVLKSLTAKPICNLRCSTHNHTCTHTCSARSHNHFGLYRKRLSVRVSNPEWSTLTCSFFHAICTERVCSSRLISYYSFFLAISFLSLFIVIMIILFGSHSLFSSTWRPTNLQSLAQHTRQTTING